MRNKMKRQTTEVWGNFMEELLAEMEGKEVDLVVAAGVTLRGKVSSVSGGVVVIEDDDGKRFNVSVAHVAAFGESTHSNSRPGFIA
jgi:sRNA-binding regulator protein Hfq